LTQCFGSSTVSSAKTRKKERRLDLDRLKRLVIIAMFSDDDLMDLLVLKGGNALDIVHEAAFRSSIDLDFSIENEFSKDDLAAVREKVKQTLKNTFRAEGFKVFDVKLAEKPKEISAAMAPFWGGYQVDFKLIESEKYLKHRNDIAATRRNAAVIGPKNKKTFRIDISKFEYCRPKEERDLEGYTIYVYTPEMIVFEKLRAICQQMPEYAKHVKNPSRSARARDFFDIYTVFKKFGVDLKSQENFELLKNIFDAKRVPLELLERIKDYREYHRPDFDAVRTTVKRTYQLRDFDYYFDYVARRVKALKAFWKI
jgi:predicted nucleotidyltransferase component of viral defense system